MIDNLKFNTHTDADAGASTLTTQKWGGLASFLLAAAFIVAPAIYLFGNLRDAMGPFAYSLADFLSGPVPRGTSWGGRWC